jgi:hypothetical protein
MGCGILAPVRVLCPPWPRPRLFRQRWGNFQSSCFHDVSAIFDSHDSVFSGTIFTRHGFTENEFFACFYYTTPCQVPQAPLGEAFNGRPSETFRI